MGHEKDPKIPQRKKPSGLEKEDPVVQRAQLVLPFNEGDMKLVPHSYNWDGWAQRALALIRGCHVTLAQATQEQSFLQETCRLLVEVGGYPLAWIGLAEDDESKNIRPVAQAGLALGLIDRLPRTWAEEDPKLDPTGAAIRSNQPVFCPDIQSEPSCAFWEEVAEALGLTSCLALPLSHQGRIFGALTLYASGTATFSTDEREFLRILSSGIGQGLAHLRLKKELSQVESHLALKTQMLDSSPYAIFIQDLKGTITSVNHPACQATGFSEDELLGRNWRDLERPEYAKLVKDQRQELISQGETVITSAHRRKDGSSFPVETHSRVMDMAGEKNILSVVLDISERQRLEEILQECEERYRSIFDNEQVGVFRYRPSDGAILECNDRLAQMFGYPGKEDFLQEFVPREHYVEADTHERLLDQVENGQLQNFEASFFRRDGSTAQLLFSGRIYADLDYMEVVASDITELKQSETSRLQAEEQYRTLVEQLLGRILLFTAEHQQLSQGIQREKDSFEKIVRTSNDGVVEFDQDLSIDLWNPTMERLTGLPRKKVLNKNLCEVLPLLQETQRESPFLGSGRPKHFLNQDQLHKLTPSGSEGYFSGYYTPILDEAGEVNGGLVVIHDHTLLKRAQIAIQEQQAVLEGVMATVEEGIAVLDQDLTFLKVNSTLEKWFIHDLPLVGKTCHAVIHGAKEPCQVCPAMKTLVSGKPSREVVPKSTAPGAAQGWVDLLTSPLNDTKTGETVGVIFRALDITGQRHTEEALKDSQERLRLVVDNLPVLMGRLYPDGAVDFLENKIENLVGYSRQEFASGRSLWHDQMVLPEDQKAARKVYLQALGTDHTYVREYRVKTKDGRVIWLQESGYITCDSNGRALYTDIVLQDVTERKQAEELRPQIEAQLRHSQRMDAIGSLAGGIAHDFNNILGVMLGYTEMALMGLKEGDGLKRRLQQVLKAGKRGKELVSQILAFSRPSSQERRPVHMSSIIREALNMLRATLPTTIELKIKLEEEQDTTLADSTQLHQVVFNLCANAAHAMRDKGGLLEVSVKPVNLKDKDASQIHGVSPGPYLKLSIRDTGCGMDRNVMEKIFDPFFTTKKPGEGTGMGLTVVHGIVKAHEGAITVQSRPGKGTEFRVYLPRVEVAETTVTTEGAAVELGQERLLFVDDEEWLVDMWREILESLGFRVTATTSAPEALDLFRRDPEAIDLVITDQTMPQLTGLELTSELLSLRPDLPIILCTGFSELVTPEKAREMGIREYIMKPLSISELTTAISRALGEKTPPESESRA